MKRLIALLPLALLLLFMGCQKDDPQEKDKELVTLDLKITSFVFKAENNKILKEDCIGTINGDEIIVNCPELTSAISLTPTVKGIYEKIYCNGAKVISDQTALDFSKTSEIVLHDGAGHKKAYYINVVGHNLIPRVFINTEKEISSRTDYIDATITVNNYPGKGTFTAKGKVRGRGNATFLSYPKKAYRFKLDEGSKVAGMSKNRDWCLLAEYCDKSLMRNTWLFEMSKAAGCEWTPQYIHVDLYLNGAYNGTYLLCEQVEKANDKIVMEDDGFMIENDNYYSWEPVFFQTSSFGLYYTFKYPDNIAKHDDNYTYIKGFMNEMEAALKGSDSKDPEKGYRKYLDVPSFVKWYLVMEILGNHDPNFFYVQPKRGDKLKMYPVWDAEWTLGIASAGPNGWQYYPEKPLYTETSEMYRTRRYFSRLFRDPYFVEQVYNAWQDLKPHLGEVRENVAKEAEYIKYSQEDNFKKWQILGKPVSVNIIFFNTWQEEVDYAAQWFDKRVEWFDTYIRDLYNSTK